MPDPAPELYRHDPSLVLGPIEYSFAPSLPAIRLARHVLANWLELQPGVAIDAMDDLLIACSELVTNAVSHATGSGAVVILRARVDGDVVCLEVEDDGGGFAWPVARVMADVPGSDEHGRGLFIVEALTDELEVRAADGRNVVRCCKRGVVRQPPSPGDGQLSARFRAASHPSDGNARRSAP